MVEMQCIPVEATFFLATRACIGSGGAVQCNAMESIFLPCIGGGGGAMQCNKKIYFLAMQPCIGDGGGCAVFSLRPRAL